MPCNSFDGRTVYAIGDEPPAMHLHAPLEVLEVAWRGRRRPNRLRKCAGARPQFEGKVVFVPDAFAPLASFVVKMSRRVRGLLTWNAVLSLLGNACLADEMAQIVTIGPVIKQITDENVEGSEEDMYKLALRNATFGDAMGVFGSQLIPWHVYLGFYVGIASGVNPLVEITNMDFLKYNFMAYIAVGSLLILTFTGLDRFVPLFKLPTEPAVQLKKKASESKAA